MKRLVLLSLVALLFVPSVADACGRRAARVEARRGASGFRVVTKVRVFGATFTAPCGATGCPIR